MSSGYLDKWRKAGGPGPSRDATRADDAAFADLVDGQCDRVREMEARLRGCQGVIDSLVGRVGECETRTEAGQRLAQLTRQVTEQSFEESGEALAQLHARSRRQEDVIKKLIEEIDLLHADRPGAGAAGPAAGGAAAAPDAAALRRAVDEQVQAALRGLRAEMDERFEAAAQETHNDVKRMVSQVTTAMADLHTDMTSLKEFVREEVRATRRHCDEQLRGLAAKADSATAAAAAAAAAATAAAQRQSKADRGDDEDEGGGEAFQSRVVSNVVALQQHCRKLDAQAAEHSLQLRSVEAAVPRLDEVDRRMLGLEKLKADFGEHMGVFKGHLQKQTKRAVDTATAIQQLIEMTDASRAAIGTEITGVKDWAMQCLQRLRKRTEGAMQDARLARDDVAELSNTLTRGQVSQDRHADVLRELLTQQAGKTSILHDALDMKVKAKAAAAAAAAAAAPLQQRTAAAAVAGDDEAGWEPADATRALHDHYAKAKTRAADAQRELSDCEPQVTATAATATTGREKRQHHHHSQQQQQQRRRGGSPGGRRAARTTEGGAARRRDIASHLQDLYSD